MSKTIKEGCPICGGDVKGSNDDGYYCAHCNVLFKRKDLDLGFGKAAIKDLLNQHFDHDYETLMKTYGEYFHEEIRFIKDTNHLKHSEKTISIDSY